MSKIGLVCSPAQLHEGGQDRATVRQRRTDFQLGIIANERSERSCRMQTMKHLAECKQTMKVKIPVKHDLLSPILELLYMLPY